MIHYVVLFNAVWHARSIATLVLYWRLAEGDITVVPLVTCMEWLRWWYHMAGVVPPSTALAFITKMSGKHKSASLSAIQVKNWCRKISIEEKLDVISQLKKIEWIVDICCDVRFTRSCLYTLNDNADRITESSKSGTEVLYSKTATALSEWAIPKTMDVIHLHFYCIRINKHVIYKCIYTVHTVDIYCTGPCVN